MRSSSYIFDCQNVDCNTFPEMEKKKKKRYICLVVLCCASSRVAVALYPGLWTKNDIQVFKNIGIVQMF